MKGIERFFRQSQTEPADVVCDGLLVSCSPQLKWPAAVGIFLTALSLLVAGCASQPQSSQPKPGSGIAEYREITREAHKAVAATVDSLTELARPNLKTSKPHPALAGFDRAMHQLELTSVKTRARAEAIIARGQAYFDEWKLNMSAVTSQATARGDAERYARLYAHFERIRLGSGEVRAEFRPFMAGLREFRAALDTPPDMTGKSPVGSFGELTQRGQRVLKTLEAVSRELDAAETELRAAKR